MSEYLSKRLRQAVERRAGGRCEYCRCPLYDPRQHVWGEHFAWSEDYTRIFGLTPTGRATVETLHLNRAGVVSLRRILFLVSLHPPEETNNAPVSLP